MNEYMVSFFASTMDKLLLQSYQEHECCFWHISTSMCSLHACQLHNFCAASGKTNTFLIHFTKRYPLLTCQCWSVVPIRVDTDKTRPELIRWARYVSVSWLSMSISCLLGVYVDPLWSLLVIGKYTKLILANHLPFIQSPPINLSSVRDVIRPNVLI